MNQRVLCVDDEINVLEGYRRYLRKHFELDTAVGGAEALAKIAESKPYAVVISDMRMPIMDGIELLVQVRRHSPDTVRMMLTGCAELEVAIEAVNAGNVFRFLTKPCPGDLLVSAINDGLRQYELIRAEKVLLGQTLRGSVKVLCEILSLANPIAFGRADRIHRIVKAIARELNVMHPWQLEIAALLSQLGCIAVPQNVLEKAYRGQQLTDVETAMLDEHPKLGSGLLANIPRLESITELIRGQADPDCEVKDAAILRLVLRYDQLEQQGLADVEAIELLKLDAPPYSEELIEALTRFLDIQEHEEIIEIPPLELLESMTLAEDLRTSDGVLLVLCGQSVSAGMKDRLRNFAYSGRLPSNIRVRVRRNKVRV